MIPESPKARFQKLAACQWFAEVSADPRFQTACEYALLQYSLSGSVTDVTQAASRYFMDRGAREFWRVLSTLSDPIPKPQPRKADSLPNPDA